MSYRAQSLHDLCLCLCGSAQLFPHYKWTSRIPISISTDTTRISYKYVILSQSSRVDIDHRYDSLHPNSSNLQCNYHMEFVAPHQRVGLCYVALRSTL